MANEYYSDAGIEIYNEMLDTLASAKCFRCGRIEESTA